jgi:hypothetical protein
MRDCYMGTVKNVFIHLPCHLRMSIIIRSYGPGYSSIQLQDLSMACIIKLGELAYISW